LRATICMLIMVPMMLPTDQYNVMRDLILAGPMTICHILFPALASFRACWLHWRIVDHRQARALTVKRIQTQGHGLWASMPRGTVMRYFGGSFFLQLVATACTVAVTAWLTLTLMVQFVCQNHRALPLVFAGGKCPNWMWMNRSTLSSEG